MSAPLISVVMGCYNDQRFIRESIDSILSQTISDFEFIIIDDCSSDRTVEIVKSYSDPRIVLIQNKTNKGLGYNLFSGVNLSKGKYIARMDADDISLPKRFETQIGYLESHPDVLVVGTSAKKIGDISLATRLFSSTMKQSVDYNDIKARMIFGTPMLHPSVMFNGELMRNNRINYNPEFKRAQDYELWSRIVWDNKLANLPEVLIYYRYSSTQASSMNRADQISRSFPIYKNLLNYIFDTPVCESQIIKHQRLATCCQLSMNEIQDVVSWIQQLHKQIADRDLFPIQCFEEYFSKYWAVICRESVAFSKRRSMFVMIPFAQKYLKDNILRLYSKA